MITISNLKDVLNSIGYKEGKDSFIKEYQEFGCAIIVNFKEKTIQYPEESGLKVHKKTTCNFSESENFVVLECVTRLLDKGYRPEHIELEKTWSLGHEQKSGRADVLVKEDTGKTLFIIECKTYGKEYEKALKDTIHDGAQLFSYWQQEKHCKWLALYTSTLNKGKVEYKVRAIDCSDDKNLEELAKKDSSIKLYKNAYTVPDLHNVWKETHERRLLGDIFFRDDSVAYQVGVKPLRKRDLVDFSGDDKVVNRFEEILRHNNVSDKENAFNRLIALFICKLVDELQKDDDDIVEFQYKVGTDTYESLQDRLQRLHKEGMEEFMREEIYYVSDDYAEKLVKQYTSQKRVKMIEELKNTLRILKFYTNNDFAFKDVHNEELFYQNGKILVEMVQLFQDYRIIGSADLQMLGDLFEQLLNKGFKQNEGQFFTPTPITRFIWDSLPLKEIMTKTDGIEYPKIIDYACGAGHFLTEGFEAIQVSANTINNNESSSNHWVEKKIFGIEKDYRLARVSKISLFMHGSGGGNIIFGDGLENYPDKEITPKSFDILVANPPYSVKAFKPHLKLSNNQFDLLEKISNDGSEIETLFVERISQLLKPNGVAAVVLPSSILNKENESFITARESLLKNFNIVAIATLGSKTFGATGTNTVILFLQKFNEPPKRTDMVLDSVEAILSRTDTTGWEDASILREYLKKIGVTKDTYNTFLSKNEDYAFWKDDNYFCQHYNEFVNSTDYNKKRTQKTFLNLSEAEQKQWFNQKFYEYAFSVEQEKLFYYSLIYKQDTLIISAPDENKEQEKFLGYKWSNRKGQEGIQIIKAGGCLYNASDRGDNNSIAGLVRNAFSKEDTFDIEELDTYYYRLRLQDMLDFSGTSFNKSIKTTPTRVLKDIPGLKNYKLSDKNFFDLSIGNRVLSDEVVENGSTPIYSANVFEEFGRINKQNITDFSMPSILWGIDGDWMVNIMPANKPFYPTDHCGVLRIKTDDILPKYMALALQVEGEFERFSRSNRASTQRIANLIIQVPSIGEQQKIVGEIEAIDKKIADEQTIIIEQSEKVKSKFAEMFADKNKDVQQLTVSDVKSIVTKGATPTTLGYKFNVNGTINFIKVENITDNGDFLGPFDKISKECNSAMLRSELQAEDILVSIAGTLGKTAIVDEGILPANTNQAVAIIRLDKSKSILPEYLYYYLKQDSAFSQFDDMKKIANRANLSLENIDNIKIPNYCKELQLEFITYAKSCDKLKFEAQERLKELNRTREELIDKHFR